MKNLITTILVLTSVAAGSGVMAKGKDMSFLDSDKSAAATKCIVSMGLNTSACAQAGWIK